MISYDQLNATHADVLKEMASIGSGNAVTALAKMLNKKVVMPVPHVDLVDFNNISDFMGGPESIVAGVFVALSGDIRGIMMFILDMNAARCLIESLMGSLQSADGNLTDLEKSAIQEIGNIMIGAYIGSLSGLINKTIKPSVPHISIDMANAVLSVPAIEFSKVADHALFIKSDFSVDSVDICGSFFLVPDMPSFESILNALGVA